MRKYTYFISLLFTYIITLGILPVSAQTVQATSPVPEATSNFCTYVVSPIAYRSQNQYVGYLQNFLRDQYNYTISPTGYYGPLTYTYVLRIQRVLGISGPTGSVGPLTLARLRAIWCAGGPVTPTPNQSVPLISIRPISSSGNVVTLGWSVENAQSCTLNGNSVNNTIGSQTVTVSSETTYTLACISSSGQSAQQSVVIRPNGTINTSLQPAVSIYATPNTFVTGQSVMVVWSSTNANTCTLNGQSVATSGAQQVTIGSNASYTISCSNNGYTATQTLSASGVTTTCPTGSVLVNGQCVTQNICTAEARLCPNGQAMPRDPNCTWRSDMCTTSTTTTLSLTTLNSTVNGNIVITITGCKDNTYIEWGDGSVTQVKAGACTLSHQYTNGNIGQSYNILYRDGFNGPVLKSLSVVPFPALPATTTPTISSFGATNNAGQVTATWKADGVTSCMLYRYSSLGPNGQIYYDGYKVAVGGNLPVPGSYTTPYIPTSNNGQNLGYMQLSLECSYPGWSSVVKSNYAVNGSTNNASTTIALAVLSNPNITMGQAIPISYKIENNSRPNTQLLLQVEAVAQNSGGVGGGTWVSPVIAPQSTSDTYNWPTGGGYMNASGSYKVTAYIVQCEPQGCAYNYDSQGGLGRQIYAKSAPIFFNLLPNTTTNTISSFTATNNAGQVTVNWTSTGATSCSLYRYSSLGPADDSYSSLYKVLVASNLPTSGTGSTSYIGTSGNWPAPGYMQLSMECGTAKSNYSVAGYVSSNIVINSRSGDTGTVTVSGNTVTITPSNVSSTIAVEWGDGVANGCSGSLCNTYTYTYQSAGTYIITIKGFGGSVLGTINITVLMGMTTQSINLLSKVNGNITVNVTNCKDNTYIEWGDGSITQMKAGSCTVSHQYVNGSIGQQYNILYRDGFNGPVLDTLTVIPFPIV